ncbi:phage terminase large subunit family protein [Roseibium polysiphoniae]|uniref:Phage terminase large subunit family protein n=1 Tax=Roseibium polysiphoniae TaxID=2571221 RepID=A0ABR9C6B8_9HYPH|nr:terminase gpA endonuclease subunit [Roseibium polysiphoniae]MBD8875427.1 phage terminase large subunit family protein [Roseibium polysiphoniae]
MNAFRMPERPHGWRPPQYARAVGCLRAALPTIAPIRRQAVSAWSEQSRFLLDNGSVVPWRNSVTPYMVEPMDTTTSRRFRAAVFVGPARTGKTDALILNKTAHTICCDPQDLRIVHMSQDAAREFSRKKLGQLIRYTPDVSERLGKERYDDNTLIKNFEGNMSVDVAWPVVAKMSASDIPLMLLTDYDRMPEDIGGEGTAFDLSFKRTQTFGSRGMTVVESSPGRPVLDDDFDAPETERHLAPPCTGILSLYNRGTRGRFYWPCPDCSSLFEPDFKLLQYPEKGTPAEKGAGAFLACPHCGCVLEHRHKRERNQFAQWLHESRIGELVPIHDDSLRETDIASWWLNGTVAAFQSWAELVTRYEGALEEFDRTRDSKALKTTITVDQGKPFSERLIADEDELSVKELKDRAEPYALNIAPAESRFLLIAVDVQKGRFVVEVFAFGVELEHWVIARFDMHTPPSSAPRAQERAIDPARYSEDWDALFDLLEREFPVLGAPFSLVPVALVVDGFGEEGVTKHAYAFYRRAKAKGYRGRVFISKGMRGYDRDRAVLRTPEKQEGKRLKKASDLKILQIGTWKMKNELVAALSRTDPGPGACHLSKNLPTDVFEELCAEEKTSKGWELKKGKKRNEAFDLGVYALALVIVLKGERINWDRPPTWAAELDRNAFARARSLAFTSDSKEPDAQDVAREEEQPEPSLEPAQQTSKPSRKKRPRSRRRRGFGDY